MSRKNRGSAGAAVSSLPNQGEQGAPRKEAGPRRAAGNVGGGDQPTPNDEQVPGPQPSGIKLPDRLPATIPVFTARLEGLKLTSPNRTRFATRGGAMAQAAKAKRLREIGLLTTRGHVSALCLKGPVTYGASVKVTIVRIAPRAFDDDNFVSSCKPLRDGIADAFGLKDHDPRISFWYEQRRGNPREYTVLVQYLVTS